MKQITFVCTGNVCRSAAAEAVLKRMLADRNVTGVTVNSVGMLNLCGADRDGLMSRIAARNGYVMDGKSTFRSREVFRSADLILVMTHTHKLEVQNLLPREQWHKIRLFIEYSFGMDESLADPSGMPEDVYMLAWTLIEKGCKVIADKLLEESQKEPWEL